MVGATNAVPGAEAEELEGEAVLDFKSGTSFPRGGRRKYLIPARNEISGLRVSGA
jgi:hypothetical protein